MTVLVGANNAGKTNILSALNVLLGPRWPVITSFSDRDFFGRDPTQPIRIQVWLGGDDTDTETMWLHVDADNRESTGLWSRYKRTDKNYKLSNTVRDAIPLIYLGADRSYERQFGVSRWTLLGQAVERLHQGFRDLGEPERATRIEQLLKEAADLLKVGHYSAFAAAFKDAFQQQISGSPYEVGVDFRTFSPLNLYKSLQPVIFEDGAFKDPEEAGAGMRNLMLLALFRATAAISRGSAVMVVEEPELYLHPHAQRSLSAMLRELASSGTQILISTHSASFVSPESFDEVAIVERRANPGAEDRVSTQVKRSTPAKVIALMSTVRGGPPITEAGLRERLRHLCGIPQAEAMFGRAVVLVEGASELAALQVFARHLGYPFDSLGISVIDCEGKDNVEIFHHLYRSLDLPIYAVVDNDRTKHALATARAEESEKHRQTKANIERANAKVSAFLGLRGSTIPEAVIGDRAAVLEDDFEAAMKADLEKVTPGLYNALKQEAASTYGGSQGKPAVARFMAERLVAQCIVPNTMKMIIFHIADLVSALRHTDREALELHRILG
jgi:putative ATP-dependent endonuclease of OLD family